MSPPTARAYDRMSSAKVLAIGLTGMAAEACKNIVLAGVGTVALVDNTPVSSAAPGNFLAVMEASADAQTVAAATAETLREMNPFCKVEVLAIGLKDVTQEVVKGFNTVLVSGQSLVRRR